MTLSKAETEFLWTIATCEGDTDNDGKLTHEEFVALTKKKDNVEDHAACLPAGCNKDEYRAFVKKVENLLKL